MDLSAVSLLRWLVALLFMWVATGCTHRWQGDRPEVDMALPETWSAGGSDVFSAEEVIVEEWIASFEDAALTDFVEQALAENNDLRAAAARLDAAGALRTIAGADRLPQVSLSLDGNRQKRNFSSFGLGNQSSVSDSFQLGVGARWELDVWGKLRAQAAAGVADFEAQAAVYENARLSLAGQVALAWFGLIESEQQRQLAEETVKSYEDSLATITLGFDRGVNPALDVRLARAQLAGAEANLQFSERVLDEAKRRFQVIVGEYPDGELGLPSALPSLQAGVPVGLPLELIERRPDLRAAEQQMLAADARLVQAKRSLLPSISLTGNVGTASDALEDLLDSDFSVWNLAGNLVQPLFEGKRLTARVEQFRAQLQEQVALYGQAVLTALSEVEVALAAERFLAAEEGRLLAAVEESSASEQLARERYQRGLLDIITVLESQRREFEARSRWLAVSRQRLENRVQLHLALGGGFELAVEQEES